MRKDNHKIEVLYELEKKYDNTDWQVALRRNRKLY